MCFTEEKIGATEHNSRRTEQGLLGQPGDPPRKAGSIPVGDTLLPPHGHGIACTSPNRHGAGRGLGFDSQDAWGSPRCSHHHSGTLGPHLQG